MSRRRAMIGAQSSPVINIFADAILNTDYTGDVVSDLGIYALAGTVINPGNTAFVNTIDGRGFDHSITNSPAAAGHIAYATNPVFNIVTGVWSFGCYLSDVTYTTPQYIFAVGQYATGYNYASIRIDPNLGGGHNLRVIVSEGQDTQFNYTDVAITTNTDKRLLITHDPATRRIEVWDDGVLLTGFIGNSSSAPSKSIYDIAGPTIGYFGSDPTAPLTSTQSKVALWDRILTPAEISAFFV